MGEAKESFPRLPFRNFFIKKFVKGNPPADGPESSLKPIWHMPSPLLGVFLGMETVMKLEKLILRNPVVFILVMVLLPLVVTFVMVETGVIAPGSTKGIGPYYYEKIMAFFASVLSFFLSIFLLCVAECCVTEDKAEATEVFEVVHGENPVREQEVLRLVNSAESR